MVKNIRLRININFLIKNEILETLTKTPTEAETGSSMKPTRQLQLKPFNVSTHSELIGQVCVPSAHSSTGTQPHSGLIAACLCA